MDHQIKLFTPSIKDLEGLDALISDVPELQDIIEESDYHLNKIIESVDGSKLGESIKRGIKQLFAALQKTHCSEKVYKYYTFRNQNIIDQLLKREEEYKKIIEKQAKKHSDMTGMEDMNKIFSSLVITPYKNKKVSYHTNQTFKNIKKYKDFEPIFTVSGEKTYTKEELIKMKALKNKGPMFNNVEKITVVNTDKDIVVVKQL